MQVDTHVHLLVSKSARPDWQEIEFCFEVARRDGLDALCIAEHRDADGYEELIEGIFLRPKFDGQILEPGVILLANGLVLSSAAEVAIRGGGDIGIHTSPEKLLAIPKDKGIVSGIELLEMLSRDASEYVAVLHHLLIPGKWPIDVEAWGIKVDAIELPGKQLESETEYRSIAEKLSKPIVGGSDSHTWIQIGICRTELLDSTELYFSPKMFKASLAECQVKALPITNSARFVSLSKLYRARLELQRRDVKKYE